LRTPIGKQVNGVENMLYMSSQSASDGNMTFRSRSSSATKSGYGAGLGPKTASLSAIPVLPPDVQTHRVPRKNNRPTSRWSLHLVFAGWIARSTFYSNYALLQIRDELARLDGVAMSMFLVAREYSMRLGSILTSFLRVD